MDETKQKFCEFCDSKGMRHKKVCTRAGVPLEPNSPETIVEPGDDKIKVLEQKFDKLVDLVSQLAERITAPNTLLPQPVVQQPPSRIEEFVTEQKEHDNASQLVPRSWRKIVDDMLGQDFGVEIDDSSNGNFVLKVLVPQQFDRRIGLERGPGQDCSTGLIRRASALADVEKWCTLIGQNISKFYPTFKK